MYILSKFLGILNLVHHHPMVRREIEWNLKSIQHRRSSGKHSQLADSG